MQAKCIIAIVAIRSSETRQRRIVETMEIVAKVHPRYRKLCQRAIVRYGCSARCLDIIQVQIGQIRVI